MRRCQAIQDCLHPVADGRRRPLSHRLVPVLVEVGGTEVVASQGCRGHPMGRTACADLRELVGGYAALAASFHSRCSVPSGTV